MATAVSDQDRALLACCRPDAQPQGDRRMRQALAHMETDPALKDAFARQAEFDDHMAALVRGLPLPECFATEIDAGLRESAHGKKTASKWRGLLRQPVFWAVMLAGAVLLSYAGSIVYDHVTGFPGDDTVRQLIETARTGPHADHLEPLATEASQLGDKLFIQYGLEDYEVPAVFGHAATESYRVFAKNDSLVAEVVAQDRGQPLVFLMFRADQQGVNIHLPGHWKFLRGDAWSAAVMIRHHVGFVAITPGDGAALREYLEKSEARSWKPEAWHTKAPRPTEKGVGPAAAPPDATPPTPPAGPSH